MLFSWIGVFFTAEVVETPFTFLYTIQLLYIVGRSFWNFGVSFVFRNSALQSLQSLLAAFI